MMQTPSQHHVVHHEESDVDVRAILNGGVALTIVVLTAGGLVWLLFWYLNGREATNLRTQFPLAAGQELRLPPEPRLQVTPRLELRELRAREDRILNSYQWVDREAGTVRIPIAEAMRLTVQRGFPVRESTAQVKP